MENEPHRPVAPRSIEELQALVKDSSSVRILGSDEPPEISPDTSFVSLSALDQIVEYSPEEYTITVQAGMTVAAVQAALAEKGQYLPFDPPFISQGTTIGAMIAKGLSGPGSFRYGILRDFILGVNFVDGLGESIHTGGKVVKNAAGFDIPKLMTGSLGSFGIITEASFKVFPLSPEKRSLVFRFPSFQEGHQAFVTLGRSQFSLDALDLDPQGNLFIELAGQPGSMDQRVDALEHQLNRPSQTFSEEESRDFWAPSVRLDTPPPSGAVFKVPQTPKSIEPLEQALLPFETARRYSIGGYVAWIHWESDIETLSSLLESHHWSGQLASGCSTAKLIGDSPQKGFYQRLKSAFDPERKFVELYSTRLKPALYE